MWRFIVIGILLLGLPATASGISPAPEPAEALLQFLPLIFKVYPPPFDVVITLHTSCGPPPNYSSLVYGYAIDAIPEPLYNAILEVDILTLSCFEEDCETIYRTERISPALPALLPGQVNPFAYAGFCEAKFEDHIIDVRPVSASRSEPDGTVYYPLTIPAWEQVGDTLSGTVRNDNNVALQNLELVAQELTRCWWREAEIASATLGAGQETTFTIDFPEYCQGENLVIVGQGAAQP